MGLIHHSGTYSQDILVPDGTIITVSGASQQLGGYSMAREAVIQVNVSAVSGTTPSLTVNLQDSVDDGANWNTVASTSAISATGLTVLRVPITTPFASNLRISYSVSGTTPSFTLGIRGYFATAGNAGR